jgi:hypothetical protein
VPIRLIGTAGRSRYFHRALLDLGADDTIFPIHVAPLVGVAFRSDPGFMLRWRGQAYQLRFGDVELVLTDSTGATYRWPATVGFSPAPIHYPILGNAGCLCYFDAMFRGQARVVELQTNPSYPGTPP